MDFFINEITSNNRNLLSENKELIIQIFKASDSHNLRILRQCLNDYSRIVMALPEHYHESSKYHQIISSLLANFIAVYCEYKSGNTDIAEIFNEMATVSDNNSETYQKREKILSKYRFIGMGQNLGILDEFIVGRIIHYLNSGFFDTEYMQHFFDIDDADIKSWEHLYDYWRLSNYEYRKYCDETITYYSENKCENLKELFVIISVLSVLSHTHLLSVSEEEIIDIGKRNIDRLMENIHEMEDLDKSNKMVHLGLRSHPNLKGKELQNKLYQYFNEILKYKIEQCPNNISVILENLSDENCDNLGRMLNVFVPIKNVPYIATPFFKFADPQKVANRIMGLSNESKNTFYQFLLYRYDVLFNGDNKYMEEEIPNLELIGEALKEKAEQTELIEKFSLNQIISVIEKIVEQSKQE